MQNGTPHAGQAVIPGPGMAPPPQNMPPSGFPHGMSVVPPAGSAPQVPQGYAPLGAAAPLPEAWGGAPAPVQPQPQVPPPTPVQPQPNPPVQPPVQAAQVVTPPANTAPSPAAPVPTNGPGASKSKAKTPPPPASASASAQAASDSADTKKRQASPKTLADRLRAQLANVADLASELRALGVTVRFSMPEMPFGEDPDTANPEVEIFREAQREDF